MRVPVTVEVIFIVLGILAFLTLNLSSSWSESREVLVSGSIALPPSGIRVLNIEYPDMILYAKNASIRCLFVGVGNVFSIVLLPRGEYSKFLAGDDYEALYTGHGAGSYEFLISSEELIGLGGEELIAILISHGSGAGEVSYMVEAVYLEKGYAGPLKDPLVRSSVILAGLVFIFLAAAVHVKRRPTP
jgi:hypothetical protein